jgi:LacI family transcriptional regulator
MMAGEVIEPTIHTIDPREIVTRMSTDIIAVEDPYVVEAMKYIREHAYEEMKVEDLLAFIPLSRRSLDHRFLNAIGRTPHEEIMTTKIKLISRMLVETDWTMPVIAEQLGFKHPEYMSVVFKKYTGLSPGAYRDKKKVHATS